MKNYVLAILATAILFACQTPANSDKEEVQEVPVIYASYGAEMTSEGASYIMALTDLMQVQDSLEMKLTGSIEKRVREKVAG